MTVRRRALALLLVSASVTACGSATPTASAPPSIARSPSPFAAASPAVAGSPAAGGSPSVQPSAGGIVADASLLDLLPAAAAGLKLTYDAETTASVMTDPGLAHDAAAVATGLATPAGQAPAEEFVIVNAVRLRDPSLNEDWFRSWRDSYDGAACAQAGGVTGHAQTEIRGRTVFIGSCANGVFTYHTRLRDGGVVLSLTSIGPSRLGEKLLGQLAP